MRSLLSNVTAIRVMYGLPIARDLTSGYAPVQL